jgi:hypothetical protein
MPRSATAHRLAWPALLALCLLLPACGKSKVNKANYDRITTGMTLQEVEGILGKGTKEEGGDGTNVAAQFGVHIESAPSSRSGETYTWEKGSKKITVYFLSGKVTNKREEGLSGEKGK